MPLVHGDYEHLLSNSIPLWVLMAGILYLYREISIPVFLFSYFTPSLWVWAMARQNPHIGASGMIFAFAFFSVFQWYTSQRNQNARFVFNCSLPIWRYDLGSFSWKTGRFLGGAFIWRDYRCFTSLGIPQKGPTEKKVAGNTKQTGPRISLGPGIINSFSPHQRAFNIPMMNKIETKRAGLIPARSILKILMFCLIS